MTIHFAGTREVGPIKKGVKPEYGLPARPSRVRKVDRDTAFWTRERSEIQEIGELRQEMPSHTEASAESEGSEENLGRELEGA